MTRLISQRGRLFYKESLPGSPSQIDHSRQPAAENCDWLNLRCDNCHVMLIYSKIKKKYSKNKRHRYIKV
jgi:hypothetical protein